MRAPASSISDEFRDATGLRHEAWLYEGPGQFVAGAVPFVRAGLAAGEAVMVATVPQNLEGLRDSLGRDADAVKLVDMSDAGRNPGRILSLWRAFVADDAHGRPARGIGEPVWHGRTPDELDECSRHEALINASFDGDVDFWLVCPYDTATLDEATLAAVERTHPFVHAGGAVRPARSFDPALAGRALEGRLPSPPADCERVAFDGQELVDLRRFVRVGAERAGLAAHRVEDLLVAVTELAANSIRHGGGGGVAAIWSDGDAVICEVEGRGRIVDPLVGRTKPPSQEPEGRGLWIVHELCDLVRLRSSDRGTTARVLMRLH